VQHIDIAPTILDFAGISYPGTSGSPVSQLDGHSLLPYVRGESNKPIYPYLVAEECTRMMKWALRTDRYKYILARQQDYRNYPMEELYDLQADPEELHNLAEARPDTARELKATLESWIAGMMKKNGWTEDPLLASGLTLGTDWVKWVKEHGYW
jgi:arylsulfatase A-like enzyme